MNASSLRRNIYIRAGICIGVMGMVRKSLQDSRLAAWRIYQYDGTGLKA